MVNVVDPLIALSLSLVGSYDDLFLINSIDSVLPRLHRNLFCCGDLMGTPLSHVLRVCGKVPSVIHCSIDSDLSAVLLAVLQTAQVMYLVANSSSAISANDSLRQGLYVFLI